MSSTITTTEAFGELALLVAHALPVACAAWTFTHEEVFREVHEWLERQCKPDRPLLVRKFCFLFTCEYCLSHWISLLVLLVTGYRPLYGGWLGLGLGFFAVPWLAVLMMDVHQRLRVGIREGRAAASKDEKTTPGP